MPHSLVTLRFFEEAELDRIRAAVRRVGRKSFTYWQISDILPHEEYLYRLRKYNVISMRQRQRIGRNRAILWTFSDAALDRLFPEGVPECSAPSAPAR